MRGRGGGGVVLVFRAVILVPTVPKNTPNRPRKPEAYVLNIQSRYSSAMTKWRAVDEPLAEYSETEASADSADASGDKQPRRRLRSLLSRGGQSQDSTTDTNASTGINAQPTVPADSPSMEPSMEEASIETSSIDKSRSNTSASSSNSSSASVEPSAPVVTVQQPDTDSTNVDSNNSQQFLTDREKTPASAAAEVERSSKDSLDLREGATNLVAPSESMKSSAEGSVDSGAAERRRRRALSVDLDSDFQVRAHYNAHK